jgi:F-type H+-transporting ATPase subunit d
MAPPIYSSRKLT